MAMGYNQAVDMSVFVMCCFWYSVNCTSSGLHITGKSKSKCDSKHRMHLAYQRNISKCSCDVAHGSMPSNKTHHLSHHLP